MSDWTNERLDNLANTVEANAAAIAQLRQAVAETNRSLLTTNQNMEGLIAAMARQNEANTQLFQAIVEEIRGLRAENRRILEHLFDDRPQSNN